MKSWSWLKGAIFCFVIGLIFFIYNLSRASFEAPFGMGMISSAGILFYYFIPFLIFLFFFGMLAGFLFDKLKSYSENKSIEIYVYLILAIVLIIIFLVTYNFSFHSFRYFWFYFYIIYIIPLASFFYLSIIFFKSKAKILVIILSLIFIFLVFLTFTSIPCKTTNTFCKYDTCKSGTYYDRILGKCVENRENCIITYDDYGGNGQCVNNLNGKILCDGKLKKCVENVKFCVTNWDCGFNNNGKTVCYYYSRSEIDVNIPNTEKLTCVEPEKKYNASWITNVAELKSKEYKYNYSDPESIEVYNKIVAARNRVDIT